MNSDQPVAPDSTLEKSPDNHNAGETSVTEVTPVTTNTAVAHDNLPYYTLFVAMCILVVVIAVIILRKARRKHL
jgi:hypothetical protein